MIRCQLKYRTAGSSDHMTQVVQELANVRLEAEKLSAENESLNKNYESLLKVSSFRECFTGSLAFSRFKVWVKFGCQFCRLWRGNVPIPKQNKKSLTLKSRSVLEKLR